MRTRFFFTAVATSCVIAACISDEPAPAVANAPDAATPDAAGPTLPAPDAGTVTLDDAGTTPPQDEDAGPMPSEPCKFQPTPYPCGGDNPGIACWGAAQSCTGTMCVDLAWFCNSKRQCNNTACCLAKERATVAFQPDCSGGSLILKPGTVGAQCAQDIACPPDTTQFCQGNADCPTGKKCKPLKIAGGPASINGNIIGACTD